MSSAEILSDPITITIGGQHWDPARTYADDAARTNYITVTTFSPLDPNEHQELAGLNAVIQEQVASDTYLCYYKPPDLGPIRSLPFVRQADVFRSKFKIVQDLKDTNVATTNGVAVPVPGLATTELITSVDVCTVDIVLHQGRKAEEILSDLCAEAQVDPKMVEYTSRKIRMTVDRSRLKLIATHDYIRSLEEVVPKAVHNNLARDIMEADIVINGTPYHGEGQVITVSDTGFDIGDKEKCHPAFRGSVLDLVSVLSPKPENPRLPELTYDMLGHGTHVCGSIVGQNMASKAFNEDAVGGIAQKAKLIVQSMYYENKQTTETGIRTPLDLTEGLFDTPYYESGCRIFSNSWGDKMEKVVGQRSYTEGAKEIDEFVWRTGDAVVLFSAGNDNEEMEGKPAIGAQPSAKNCITVGATGSKRVTNGNGEGKEHESMYICSSKGPTKEGRIKPDVVAPGVRILSTSTQVPSLQKRYKRRPTYDQYFRTESGTSMSTPLVAGCVAILLEVLNKHGCPNPSAALVKALIINGAEWLDGVPRDAQGFGRVNLKRSVAMITSAGNIGQDCRMCPNGYCEGKALSQGEVAKFSFVVPEGDALIADGKLKVTLAYSDVPGPVLQNNLVLTVAVPGGVEMHGNGFSGAEYDTLNNVEQVVYEDMRSGEIEVSVWAQKITLAGQTQGFGLAWSYM